ncbi:MAG: ribonuclease III [Candidatus Latescibacterota bacterium]|nr:ribonuclease III [Candidatus Latescibacterota bacterium]
MPKASIEGLHQDQVRELEERLQHCFRDRQLLATALKHRSYVYAHDGNGLDSNERLEYLGDAVLDLVAAEFLFHRYQDRREGELTQMKSLVVSRVVLARRARTIDLGRFILLSQEERAAGGADQDSILSDAFEAVIGALFLDGGLRTAQRFVERTVLHDLDEIHRREDFLNFKSRLLEHVQSQGSGHPKYYVQNEVGPDHDKLFSVEVSVIGETLGSGQGRSKKEAQQMAARDALHRLGQT